MNVDTIREEMEELEVTDGTNLRRRKTDITPPAIITQPLDYETEELVTEYDGSQ
jgi:hypothetical protein